MTKIYANRFLNSNIQIIEFNNKIIDIEYIRSNMLVIDIKYNIFYKVNVMTKKLQALFTDNEIIFSKEYENFALEKLKRFIRARESDANIIRKYEIDKLEKNRLAFINDLIYNENNKPRIEKIEELLFKNEFIKKEGEFFNILKKSDLYKTKPETRLKKGIYFIIKLKDYKAFIVLDEKNRFHEFDWLKSSEALNDLLTNLEKIDFNNKKR